jgi:hypothetical protein
MMGDRSSLIILMAILGVLSICLVSLLLAQGMATILGLIILGTRIIAELPQILWWGAGVAVLIIGGLRVLCRLGTVMWFRSEESTPASFSPGRLGVIHRSLSRTGYGEYSRNEVRKLLGSLTIDVIALKLDIPETEATRLFREGNWTEDSDLASSLLPQQSSPEQGRSLWRRIKKSRSAPFLEETQNTLDRIQKLHSCHFERSEAKREICKPAPPDPTDFSPSARNDTY